MANTQPDTRLLADAIDSGYNLSLSEVDSISDSDWLDISSRASDDNESIGLIESDRDDAFRRPPSRQSLSSNSSSRDGDVEAEGWEGFVEDADESGVDGPSVPVSSSPIRDAQSLPTDEPTVTNPEEDQLVRAALDQSMMSTLSSSRSNSLSGSTHSPGASRLHDLRLSFPDPLTSSRDELQGSFEDLSPASSDPLTLDDTEPEVDPLSLCSQDPGLPTTPAVPDMHGDDIPDTEFQIVLYGHSAANKWHLVEILLSKLASGSGLILSEREIQLPRTSIYWLNAKGNAPHLTLGRAVSVIDKTGLPVNLNPSARRESTKSLAVFYLPASVFALPEHTLYLPAIVTTSSDDGSTSSSRAVDRTAIERHWNEFAVPMDKLLLIDSERPSSIITEDELVSLDEAEVVRGFDPLLSQERKAIRALQERLTSTPAVAILAILSIVIGCIVTCTSPVPIQVLSPVEKHSQTMSVGVFSNAANRSVPLTITSSIPLAPSPSSFRDIALAVFSPVHASVSTASAAQPSARSPTTSGTAAVVKSEMPRTDKLKVDNKSLMTRPITSALSLTGSAGSKALSIFSSPEQSSVTPRATEPTPAASIYALAPRLTDSLLDLFNAKAFSHVIRTDMKELMDALDELIQVLNRQTASAWRVSRDVTVGLREEFQKRNRRAQDTARLMKEKGEKMLMEASEQALGRFGQARSKARAMKDKIRADMKTAYEQNLQKGMERKERRRERRMMRKMRKGRVGL